MKTNMRSPRHVTDSVGTQTNGKGHQRYYTWLSVTTLDYNMQVEFDDLYPDLPHGLPFGDLKRKIHKTKEQEDEKEKRKLGNRVRQERGIK